MTVEDPDMSPMDLARAAFRWVWGTDAEMEHPAFQREAEDMIRDHQVKPSLSEKIDEAHESIDKMRQSTGRLAKFQPARSLDEAIRQITGVHH